MCIHAALQQVIIIPLNMYLPLYTYLYHGADSVIFISYLPVLQYHLSENHYYIYDTTFISKRNIKKCHLHVIVWHFSNALYYSTHLGKKSVFLRQRCSIYFNAIYIFIFTICQKHSTISTYNVSLWYLGRKKMSCFILETLSRVLFL